MQVRFRKYAAILEGGNAHKNSAIRGGRQTHDEIRAAAVAAAAQTVDEKTADGTAD